jgi:hypothetical protein
MFACRARVGAWVDDNLAGRQPGGERSQGVATRARSREGVGVGVCQGRCGREQVRHSADELLQRRSQRASQIRQVCLHDSPREVLLERRTQGELLARDAARNAYPRGLRGRAGRASDPRRVPRRRRAGRRRGQEVSAARDGGGQVTKVVEAEWALDGACSRRQVHHAGCRLGGASARRYVSPLTSSRPGTACLLRNARSAVPAKGSRQLRAKLDYSRRPRAGAVGAAPQLARGGCEDGANGLVELADAPEASREGDVRKRQAGRVDQQSGGARPLGAGQRDRPGAELLAEQPAQLALAHPQPTRQARNALSVDDSVGDQSHCPCGRVRTPVPLGRARCSVRAAAFTRAESRRLRSGRGGVEADVLALSLPGGTAGPAVDPRRCDGNEEGPV